MDVPAEDSHPGPRVVQSVAVLGARRAYLRQVLEVSAAGVLSVWDAAAVSLRMGQRALLERFQLSEPHR